MAFTNTREDRNVIEHTADAISGAHTIGINLASDGGNDLAGIIALLIPVIAIVMGIGIGMLGLYLDYRKKRSIYELHHKERMAAIEKGMDVPPLPAEFFHESRRRLPRTRSDYLRRGLIWLLVGAAITAASYSEHHRQSLWGLVPAAVGLAYLLFYFIDGRDHKRDL
jgi:uncharacterized membrane protein YoaK (UPF0700 family)